MHFMLIYKSIVIPQGQFFAVSLSQASRATFQSWTAIITHQVFLFKTAFIN